MYPRFQHGSAAGCDPRQRSLRGGDPRESVQHTDRERLRDEYSEERQRAVEEINEQIKMLESKVDEHKATAAQLTRRIAEHEKKTSMWHDGVRSTNEVRQYNRGEWYNQQHGNWGCNNGWYNGGNWKSSTDGWSEGWQRGDAAAEKGRGVQRFDNN